MSKHAAFLLPHLAAGGTEKLTLELAQGFLDRGVRVDLVLMKHWGELVPLVPPQIRIIDLAAPRVREVPLPLWRYLRNERPDVLLAAMWPLTCVAIVAAAASPARPRIVVSDHCPLMRQYEHRRRLLGATIRASYPFAEAMVGASRGLADELAGLAAIPRERVTAIHNPVGRPATTNGAADSLWRGYSGKRILTVGNIKPEKNHALLLHAFAQLAREQSTVLAIVGRDDSQGDMARLASQLGIADRVIFAGYSATPGDWYKGADLFVLSSDYEGFGNVLVEAMHFGLPIVSTDCPFGPTEILAQGKWGRLVPAGNVCALASAMAAALKEQVDADALRARAREFSVERAVADYAAIMMVED